MSVKELWLIVFSLPILSISVSLGVSTAVTSAFVLMFFGEAVWLMILPFCISPILINICSASLMTMVVRYKARRSEVDAPVVVPSVLTIGLAALLVEAPLFHWGLGLTAEPFGSLWFPFVVIPFVYIVISEIFHHLVFAYIAPTVWGRRHINHLQESERPCSDEDLSAPDVVAESDREMVSIGETLVEADRIMTLEANANYVQIVTAEDTMTERFRFSDAVKLVDQEAGVLPHRSYWLAFKYMDRVERQGGQYSIVMRNNERYLVATTREVEVLKKLQAWGFDIPTRARRKANG